MPDRYTIWGAAYSGSVPVEAALTLIGVPYEVVEKPTWESQAIAAEVGQVNPMRQLPALVLPDGELLTESAAILIWLAEQHPEAGLAPAPGSPDRPAFLRWMSFISAQIYSLYWIRDDLGRLAAEPAHEPVIEQRTAARIRDCWGKMEAQVTPRGTFLFGEAISVLDLYLCAVSRFRPRRQAFYEVAPRLGAVARAVDAYPPLRDFWSMRMPRLKDAPDDDGVPAKPGYGA